MRIIEQGAVDVFLYELSECNAKGMCGLKG